MNCKIFNNKLNDYIESNLSDEMNNAMEKHRTECSLCNDLYNEEVSINNNFKRAFNINEIVFESSRSNIIASINKNRYGKNNFRKLYYKVRKNRTKLFTIAAMFAICISIVKFSTNHFNISNGFNKSGSKPIAMKAAKYSNASDQANITASTSSIHDANNGTQQDQAVAKQNTFAIQKSKEVNSSDHTNIIASTTSTNGTNNKIQQDQAVAKQNIFGIEKSKEVDSIDFSFTKQEMNNSFKPILYSSWKNSQDGLYSACIEGKQSGDVDFGIVNICLKDLKTSKYSLLKIYSWQNIDSSKFLNESDNATSVMMKKSINNDYTPKFLQWVDNERIMVIIGFAYGTVKKGGDVYLLDVLTGELKVVYKTGDKREEVESFDYENGQLNMIVNVYEDDNLMNSHEEKRTVPYVITK
jgi:hypothetical protein